jgi:DNA-binding SARP family transcriptional activator
MTDPTPIKNGSVRVRLLGGFEVEGVAERDLGSRKARTLLKVLALAGGSPVSVHRIAEILWGDKQPSRPADQVGVLVSRLRRVLGAERIIRSDAGYVLTTDWLDVSDLRGLAAVAAEARAEGRAGAAPASFAAAISASRPASHRPPQKNRSWAMRPAGSNWSTWQ